MQKSIFPIALILIVIGVGLVLFNRNTDTSVVSERANDPIHGEVSGEGVEENGGSSVSSGESSSTSDVVVRVERRDDGNYIYWEATGEEGVISYEILRRADNEAQFVVIGAIQVTGDNHGEYHYINTAVEDERSYEYKVVALR